MRLLHFLLLLCITTIHAQTITGYVYSATDGQPLDGASVYLDGTTFSTSANAEGFFKLTTPQKYDATLVISFIGFDKYRIDNPYKAGGALKINLVPTAINIDAVLVTRKPQAFKREDMLKAFREQFLGSSATARSCTILNEDDIYLTYDVAAKRLTATADKPLMIRNKALEYDISYELAAFGVQYSKKSIDYYDVVGMSMAGYTLFRDKSKYGSANKKRQEAYYGSPAHFLKTLRNNTWEKSRITLYEGNFPVKAQECMALTDSAGFVKVKLLKEARIRYEANLVATESDTLSKERRAPVRDRDYRLSTRDGKMRQSFFLFMKDEFSIDKNGRTSPLNALMFGGYMGSLKAGDMLPADYIYVE